MGWLLLEDGWISREEQMESFRLGRKFALYAAASGIAMGAVAMPTIAQEESASDDERTLDEIIVTGSYRGSVQAALDLKRDADSIVDAIVAEDIGKFPAVNLAEAVQRIPGVSITRERGEGQFVSVRGLGPIFQAVTLNGTPIAFNENNRDSGQSGRQFRFRVLPADLVAGIEVVKSPTADLIDGGIGSTINVLTKKPLDAGTFVAGSLFGHYEELSSEVTPNGSVTASWANEDETFGVLVAYSRSEREIQFDRVQIGTYGDLTTPEGVTALAPGNVRLTGEQEERIRNSVSAGAQWRPNSTFELNANVLYSTFDNEIFEDRIDLETRRAGEQVAGAAVINPDTNIITANSFSGGRISRNSELSDQSHENLSVQLDATFTLADDWMITPSFSYSEADSNLVLPLQRIDGRTTDGIDYSYNLGDDPIGQGSIVSFDVGADLSQPGAVPFRRLRIRPIDSTDEDKTFKLDIEHDMDGFISRIKAGGQYSDRNRVYERRDRTLVAIDSSQDFSSFNTRLNPPNSFGDIVGNGPHQWAGYDISIIDQFQLNPSDPPLSERSSGDLRNSYAVDEEVTAGYIRTDFQSEFQNVPVRGNVGVRYVHTKQIINGSVNEGVLDPESGEASVVTVPATFEDSYSEWLPSANAVFEINDNMLLRLAASRSIARPSLADLRSAQALNSTAVSDLEELGAAALPNLIAQGFLIGQGGNPALDPYTSWNYDMSFEWYFEEFGAMSISAFHKDISNFISRAVSNESFTVNGVTADFAISRPRNVGSANITGIELAYTNEWDVGFGNVGISGSATFTDSSINANTGDSQGLQTPADVSDFTYFVAPFYEHGPLQARVSYTWRSAYLRNPAFAGGNAFIQDRFGTLDFNVSYDATENITVFVEGVNLTDTLEKVYNSPGFFVPQDRSQAIELNDFGRSLNFGIRAKF